MSLMNKIFDILADKYQLLDPVHIWYKDGSEEYGLRLNYFAFEVGTDQERRDMSHHSTDVQTNDVGVNKEEDVRITMLDMMKSNKSLFNQCIRKPGFFADLMTRLQDSPSVCKQTTLKTMFAKTLQDSSTLLPTPEETKTKKTKANAVRKRKPTTKTPIKKEQKNPVLSLSTNKTSIIEMLTKLNFRALLREKDILQDVFKCKKRKTRSSHHNSSRQQTKFKLHGVPKEETL
jgi:hypothetical protein